MENINTHKRMCIGCGTCAGLCDYITMIMDDMGAYIPKVDTNSCTYCGKCLKVCPFSENIENEDEIGNLLFGHDEKILNNREVGYYLNCYEGFSKTHRLHSASGGVVTLFLEECLDRNIVDEVVCVGSCNENKNLYKYMFVNTSTDLKKCSKSAYYPLEISDVLKRIKQTNKTVAITALPCVAKAIRLAIQYNDKLRKNITIIVALACGGLPKKSMVDYVSMKNGVKSDEIDDLKFRIKNEKYLNKNCCMQMMIDNKKITSRFHGEAFGFAYLNKLFHHQACNCCDDIYGECADISFMDAWLAEYDKEYLGTSNVITRSFLAENIMKQIVINSDSITEVDITRAIRAQANVGLIDRKKVSAYYRTNLYKLMGFKVGDKRFVKASTKRIVASLVRAYQEYYLQNKSEYLWKKVKEKKTTIDTYDINMKKIIKNKHYFKRRLQ